ncbi:MAG: UvrD-helicase domain-containing protein [Microcoleus sp.]
MELSKYQADILQAVQQRINTPCEAIKGLLIEALAGTGKSFMLVEICSLLESAGVSPDQVRLVVFGKKNKTDLANKLGLKVGNNWKNSVSTLHSLSFQILREVLNVSSNIFKIESWKYRDIASDFKFVRYSEGWGRDRKEFPGTLFKNCPEDIVRQFERDFLTLLELLRLYCLDATVENLVKLTVLHQLEIIISEEVVKAADKCLSVGNQTALSAYWLDYTDMSWVLWKNRELCAGTLEKYRSQFRMIAVDECQDTDQLQLNILSLLINPAKNFLVAVGDRHQAVYSFRGCVSDGMVKFTELFNCKILPLPVNYRCGRSHLELVRKIFLSIPIEPWEGAGEGEIKVLKHGDFLSLFQDESKSYIGVCRKNAPLLVFAIKLLAVGKPVKIKDRSLGKRVLDEVERIIINSKIPYDCGTFFQALSNYKSEKYNKLLKYKDREARISLLTDMLAAVLALFDAYQPESFHDWEVLIERIFDESDGKRCINLYSIHSGKGGEGDVAFIIEPELMPFFHKGQTAEEKAQEDNLLYVALTRPKKILALVLGEDKNPSDISWLPQEYIDVPRKSPKKLESEISQEDLFEALGKLEKFPRAKLRTVLREIIYRLGKESVADLL